MELAQISIFMVEELKVKLGFLYSIEEKNILFDDGLNGLVKIVFVVLVDTHLDWHIVYRESNQCIFGGKLTQAGCILFGGEDDFAVATQVVEGLAYTLDIGERVFVVVAVFDGSDCGADAANILVHGLGMGNACDNKDRVEGVERQRGES